MCLVGGKPNFEAIQRRSLMSNRYKIELEAQRFPATYVAFDILYYGGDDLTMWPLAERKKALQGAVTESPRMAVSHVFDAGQALALFQIAKEQGLEGIVAKRKESLYFQGRRTREWLKIKNLQDDDFVVCGWIPKENHMASIVLGQYSGGMRQPVFKGLREDKLPEECTE